MKLAEMRAATERRSTSPVGRQVSLRVCEMEAEVRVYLRDRSVPAEEVQKVLVEKARQGVVWRGVCHNGARCLLQPYLENYSRL